MKIDRREFVKSGIGLAGISSLNLPVFEGLLPNKRIPPSRTSADSGEKQIFADDRMINVLKGLHRKAHAAGKLEKPVLEADKPWEQGEMIDGKRDRRIYIYGTVLKDQESGNFRMWYNRIRNSYYATSPDGVNWERPVVNPAGKNNMINLFEFHSPSFIYDQWEKDPSKRYKAVGSGNKVGYMAAYSADGINWKLYPKNPILESSDTITLAQDPVTHEYLAFHKTYKYPGIKGRQIFLSVSNDMQNWSPPEPVMVTDETDHLEARRLPDGTHSEFYNMSAFPYAGQWLGLVTHFRRTGEPKVKKGSGWAQSNAEGPIDIQLVHSRDGRSWHRCSDRSPVIPLGPYLYDSGSILGLCNAPVIHNDQMWMYYTAMTTTHGGYLPDKVMSIARASWRIDGMVSLRAEKEEGFVETVLLKPDGRQLIVNVDAGSGMLLSELTDENGQPLEGYAKQDCVPVQADSVRQPVGWRNKNTLPENRAFRIRFYLKSGDLFSYTIQ